MYLLIVINSSSKTEPIDDNFKGTIDRVEEEYVIIENHEENILKLPYKKSENNILKEGYCVIIRKGKIYFDKKSTLQNEKVINNLFYELAEKRVK